MMLMVLFVIPSCSRAPVQQVEEDPLYNSEGVMVALAFKANVYRYPGSLKKTDVVASLKRDDVVLVNGFAKGYIKVEVNGQAGYIAEQYLQENPFFTHWKNQWIYSRK